MERHHIEYSKRHTVRYFPHIVTLMLIVVCAMTSYGQTNTWDLFEKANFRDEYIEEYFSYATLLEYDDYAKSLDGQRITLGGHYIPVMDEDIIILSKYAYANCFFCGGAGLESVVEIRMKDKPPRKFELDEKLKFKGKLKLNTTDWEFVSFILEDAVLIAE